ncbi:Vms1/Ankzf1 family peptidyl-tRNA hydrolase [Halosimplex marinum]|uniref:baeRF10 domain-containing protein n=1 Tax=Halosimplex marinum TaxID=3396620 RepID=UPI003F55EB3F
MTDDTRHDSTDSEPNSGHSNDGEPAGGEEYGLLVVERGDAALGRVVDGGVEPVATVDGGITGSARAGTGDPDRFERERERQTREFFREVAAAADEAFLGDDPVARLAVGGPMDAATALVDGGYLDDRLTDRLVGTFTVEHASEPGLRELLDAAAADFLNPATRRLRETLAAFFERLGEGEGVVYGDADLARAVDDGTVETALVAATVDRERREEIEAAVAAQGGETLVVPEHSARGARFAETFRVGALLSDSE